MKTLTIIILFLFASSGLIENDSVDDVNIGMEISEFLESKNTVYKIKKASIKLEGADYPIFDVYDNSELIYKVEPDESEKKVYRIWLYGKKFKTNLGIGVGNTLAELREKYTLTKVSTAEGNVALLVNEIEVSFLLDNSQISKEWWSHRKMEKLDDNISIDSIII